MGKTFNPKIRRGFKKLFNLKYLAQGIYQYWHQMALLLLFIVIITRKDMSLQFNLNGATPPTSAVVMNTNFVAEPNSAPTEQQDANMEIASSLWSAVRPVKNVKPEAVPTEKAAVDENLANTYSNMTYGKKVVDEKEKARELKLLKQQSYVSRFGQVAKIEMKKFGIPASIILAQGLIESNAGDSRLATENNNHFGMKCFSSNCRKGHCSNFTDDSHKDFFRVYQTAWESYRAHSLMLQNARYRKLKKLGTKDFEAWAHGLKKAGYATDPRYAEKLIQIIKEMGLHMYDS